jgi:MoaA/NifB/PqqE/SkfB family radical SAM enzyme
MGSYANTFRHGRSGDLSAFDSFILRNGRTRVPMLVQWMATQDCPLSCQHCLVGGHKRTHEMTLREAEGVIEQVAELGVHEFLVTGRIYFSRSGN